VAVEPIDLDALQAEIRARVRRRRESGAYGEEVEAALRLPLPGARPLFTEELQRDPLAALADTLDEDVDYDPRSRKPLVGPAITFARRLLMLLVGRWIAAITDRQERVNRLLARAVADLRERPSPAFDQRLLRLEQEWQRWREDETAADLRPLYQERFSGTQDVIAPRSEALVELFRGRERVLELGSGRGAFLELMRHEGVPAYTVEGDRAMVDRARARGFEVQEGDGLAHVGQLADGSIDGFFAGQFAEYIAPGQLVNLLRQLRRVLRQGSPVVFITPNPRTVTVGAHTFWTDPGRRRPIPPELFEFYLAAEGFVDVTLQMSGPAEARLVEEGANPAMRANLRLLNETLFGARDYAIVARQPEA
jgi:SAM-dependent methyltransferase